MPSIHQFLLLTAVPILGVTVFWYSWLVEIATPFLALWTPHSLALPQVKLTQGIIVGTVLDHKFPAPIEGFMGVPYAEAPTGDRRFRRAVALPASNSTFEAKKYGPMQVLWNPSLQTPKLIELQMSRKAVAYW
jgi:acetylcholinesterase